jgi:hypothetical protein
MSPTQTDADASGRTRRIAHHPSVAGQLLLLLLMLGSFVSFAASGRLSLRLMLDGAISFAFIPVLEVLALYLVVLRWRERFAFRDVLRPFLSGNLPWLCWLVAVGALLSVIPPRTIGFGLVGSVAASAIVPFVWAFWTDVRCLIDRCGRRKAEAIRDALLHRAIGWGFGILYFFGIAIWSLVQPTMARWFGL